MLVLRNNGQLEMPEEVYNAAYKITAFTNLEIFFEGRKLLFDCPATKDTNGIVSVWLD